MAIKTWTIEATAIEYKPIELYYQDGTLYWSRGYYWTDQNGDTIKRVVDGVQFDIGEMVNGEMAFADIPANIKDALQTIDQFTKDQINAKEGIE